MWTFWPDNKPINRRDSVQMLNTAMMGTSDATEYGFTILGACFCL